MNSSAPTAAAACADLLGRGVGTPESDVLGDRAREQEGLLGHDPHLRAQRGAGHLAQVVSVDQHPALGGVVEAGYQLGHRRLAGAGRAHQSHGLSRRDVQVDVLECEDPSGPVRPRLQPRPRSLRRRRLSRCAIGLAPVRAGGGDRLYANETSSKSSSPRIRSKASAPGLSVSSGWTSKNWKIFSRAAMPDW